MPNYELILFDLDGTLTNPAEGITNSVEYALKKMSVTVENKKDLNKFIGPPLLESFENYFNFTKDESLQALGFYREYFKSKGILENFLYDGIRELLQILVNSGKRLCVATSKPEPFANSILAHFDLLKYFEFVAGSNLDGTRAKKNEVIEYALNKCSFSDKTKVIMIGDREHDIIGANKCDVASIGVLFGYGSREELEAAGAAYIADTVSDVEKILL